LSLTGWAGCFLAVGWQLMHVGRSVGLCMGQPVLLINGKRRWKVTGKGISETKGTGWLAGWLHLAWCMGSGSNGRQTAT
jgi:hypothetical protein